MVSAGWRHWAEHRSGSDASPLSAFGHARIPSVPGLILRRSVRHLSDAELLSRPACSCRLREGCSWTARCGRAAQPAVEPYQVGNVRQVLEPVEKEVDPAIVSLSHRSRDGLNQQSGFLRHGTYMACRAVAYTCSAARRPGVRVHRQQVLDSCPCPWPASSCRPAPCGRSSGVPHTVSPQVRRLAPP